MPVLLMIASLIWNYVNHKTGRPTICMRTRAAVPKWAASIGLLWLFGWLFPHLLDGYVERIEDAIHDMSDAITEAVNS